MAKQPTEGIIVLTVWPIRGNFVSNGSNGGSSGISSVGRGSVAGVGGGVTGKASVGVSVAKPVGVGHLRIGLSGGGGDSDGENDLQMSR